MATETICEAPVIHERLFQSALIAPPREGATKLLAVSGYASPSFAYQHFEALEKAKLRSTISLVVGMVGREGVRKSAHELFRHLEEVDYPGRFECWYLVDAPPVHAKVYTWASEGGAPMAAFAGSSNYSHNGFFGNREILAPIEPEMGERYYRGLLLEAVRCTDSLVDQFVPILGNSPVLRPTPLNAPFRLPQGQPPMGQEITVDLLDRNGNLPARSGLNWGQRPEHNRDPDQAYIRVPREIAVVGFFPRRGQHFGVVTDDGETFDAVIAQDGDKAIETPHDNSILGRYFRRRLGLPSGALVSRADLERYGRHTVTFTRIDDDTYRLDFAVR